ncbi:hypothetical protein C5167_024993 [Papaver somniferum]|uniref:Uncharacterized protein n=1 Tax=Papaver somniferum TaxID=3469 RepID=A0A4Y7JU56_PAPSO|nr:hypothetical protein C5167_024993 [Papaver somniferum]
MSSVLSGFQLATGAGPLCDETMWGLAFIIEANVITVEINISSDLMCMFLLNYTQLADHYGVFTGQIMTAVKEACRMAVLHKKPCLVEAMCTYCELNTPTGHLSLHHFSHTSGYGDDPIFLTLRNPDWMLRLKEE